MLIGFEPPPPQKKTPTKNDFMIFENVWFYVVFNMNTEPVPFPCTPIVEIVDFVK